MLPSAPAGAEGQAGRSPATPRKTELAFPGRTTLGGTDRVVVRAIAEAMFSEDGEVAPARLDALVDEVDRYVSQASWPVRRGLTLGLFIVRLAPVLLFYRLRTLEGLDVAQRVEVLARLERSRWSTLSLLFIGWRTVATLVFYEDASELAAIGYSDERVRHLRGLTSVESLPAPEESGVRLKGSELDHDEHEHEREHEREHDEQDQDPHDHDEHARGVG